MLPCLLFEDEHLLVVNKPAGINTHAPDPFAGEGLYDWLRNREPRWASLAIIHRLDKETSGIMVFGKTTPANRSLTEQFTQRAVRKKYFLLTDGPMKKRELTVKSHLIRTGERYASSPHGEPATTRFTIPSTNPPTQKSNNRATAATLVEAEPITGRTHQIRVHAAENGFPIFGDTLYGGTPFHRVCLHAAELALQHPATGEEMVFRAPVDFAADTRMALRTALIDSEETNALRLIHGASDGWPGWYVERLGDYLLSQGESPLSEAQQARISELQKTLRARGAYHQLVPRRARSAVSSGAAPQSASGQSAPERFIVRENGVKFELSFNEGFSTGLFLDQRENRRRALTGYIAPGFRLFDFETKAGKPPARARDSKPEVLNVFAYTCGFSVCAATAGARTTSLDLSRNYLEWGKRNFALNGLDPAAHDFIYGDAFDWLRRLARKDRLFDWIVLDPPTFSQSKKEGVFRAEKDYGKLVSAALPLLRPNGILLASCNAAAWPPEKFLASIEKAIGVAGRKITQQHYAPQPPDFPITRAEPAYLKTVWQRIA